MTYSDAPRRRWLAAAVAAVLFAVTAYALPGSEAYLEGDGAARAGRFLEAAAAFERCAADADAPLAPYAALRAALCRLRSGDAAGGIAEITEFLDNCAPGPWVAKGEAELGMALHKAGRSAEAASRFDRAFGAAPYLFWMYPYLWVAAETYVADPAHAERGWALYERMLARARTRDDRLVAARALAKGPSTAHRVLALETFVTNGERDAARTLLALVVSEGDLSADLAARTRLAEGRLLLAEKDREGALEAFAAAGSVAGADRQWARKAEAARIRELFAQDEDAATAEAALARFTAGHAGSEELAELLLWRAGRLAADEQDAQAEAMWKRLAAVCPERASADTALFRAAESARGRSADAEAVGIYTLLGERYPRSRYASEAQWRAGRILERDGDEARAIAAYGAAAEGALGDFYTHRALDRLVALGRSDLAGGPLRVDGKATLVRARRGDAAPVAAIPEAWARSDWLARLRFFGAHGLDEIEWEALALLPALDGGPTTAPLLHALSTAGAARTAMGMAEHLGFDSDEASGFGLARERVRHPLVHWGEVRAIARETRTDPLLLLAIARQESLFQPRAVSRAGATGLLQLMPSTAEWMVTVERSITAGTVRDLGHPRNSLRLGAYYLRRMLNQVDGDAALALAAYNGGPGNLSKWRRRYGTRDMDAFIDAIPFGETRDYVKKVLGNYAAYHTLYPEPDRAAGEEGAVAR